MRRLFLPLVIAAAPLGAMAHESAKGPNGGPPDPKALPAAQQKGLEAVIARLEAKAANAKAGKVKTT